MPLVLHERGQYFFLPGIAPYSCGAVSCPGFEIVHATIQRPLPYRTGFELISQHLFAVGRPKQALCGIELRSPAPYSFQGFSDFNGQYSTILKDWNLFVEGMNPVARTNVAPVVHPPAEPVLYGFSYTKPCSTDLPPTFVVAGGGELPEGVLSRDGIVALGDITDRGIETKTRFVMDLMENRLVGLGRNWDQVSTIDVYTIHSITHLLSDVILSRAGQSSIHGVAWHYSRPPIEEIEYEMDIRGTRTEIRL